VNQELSNTAAPTQRGNANVVTIALCGATDLCRDQIMAALAEMAEPLVEVVDQRPGSDEQHQRRSPDALIVALGENRETWGLQIQELGGEGIRPAIIAAINDRSGEAMRRALRAGADDIFFLPADPTDLSRCLVRVGEVRQGAGGKRAVICALSSVAGGVGVSTITTALGFAVRRLDHKRVALLDLGMQSGTLAALLDLNPEHTLSELADPTSKVDSLRLENALAAHPSGVYLLAAPKRIEESEMVSTDSVLAVLEVMRELFDMILIDCGHHMNESLIAVWEHCTHLLYPVEQSISSVRPAQRFLEMFGRLSLSGLDLQFVLNRYTPGNPFSPEKIEAAIRRPLAARIPRDDEAFIQFQLGEADLATIAPRSAATLAIENLARMLCGTPQAIDIARLPFLARVRAAFKAPAQRTAAVLTGDRRSVEPSTSGL
jgi:pilus assembly protein CpaE